MQTVIGVNGMGRIGRLLIRKAFESHDSKITIGAINSLYPAATIAHLLKYDTIHGKWHANIVDEIDYLMINGHRINVIAEADPRLIAWNEHNVHTVIEATGKFTDRLGAEKHIQAGASKVIVSAPGTNLDLTVIMGVNEQDYRHDQHHLLSTASCTTNCLVPVLKILDDAFTLKTGWMTTVHSYTNDQKHLDNPHHDLRRARACGESIIPTSTGVGKALGDIMPHLAPHIQGISIRVPTPDVSLIDLTAQLGSVVSLQELRAAFLTAVEGKYAPYVDFSDEPLVSSDFIGNDKSAVVDGLSLMAHGNQVKVLAWYDNEWAYASRVIDLAAYMAANNQSNAVNESSELIAVQ